MDPIRTTTIFFGDFPFVVVTDEGVRAQGTLAQMASRRRRDPSFKVSHAAAATTARESAWSVVGERPYCLPLSSADDTYPIRFDAAMAQQASKQV